MTKSEFISNLKEYYRLSNNAWETAERLLNLLCGLTVIYIFVEKPEGEIFKTIPLVCSLIVILIYFTGKSRRKRIDTKTSMFCQKCNQRFDEQKFAYVVLANECESCKEQIYET